MVLSASRSLDKVRYSLKWLDVNKIRTNTTARPSESSERRRRMRAGLNVGKRPGHLEPGQVAESEGGLRNSDPDPLAVSHS